MDREEKLKKIETEIEKLKIEIARKEIKLEDLEELRASIEVNGEEAAEPTRKKPDNIYSGYDDLPRGSASGGIIKGCLVAEGGAFRGVYTAGVMDRLMEEGINMECTVGVSAGALCGMNYVSGQLGRSARVNLGYRHDGRYVGLRSLREDKSIVNFRFLFETFNEIEPFDMDSFRRKDRRYIAVATDMKNGKAAYFERGKCKGIRRAIKASASMPFVTKPTVMDGVPYLDGGCADKVPYEWAMEQGYEKIIVIRTRERGYRKPPMGTGERRAAELFFHQYPEFIETLVTSNDMCNRQFEEVEKLSDEGKLFLLGPESEVKVGRLEDDMEKLGALYHQGYDETDAKIPQIRDYLNSGF